MTKVLQQLMNRKWLLIAVVALLAVFVIGHFDVAFAAGEEETDITKEATQLISMGIKTINVFLWPFLIIIGDLMDSDLIIGPGMESRLLTIWVQVRNLVNIGFVLVLLIIAFYNVLGIGGGEGNLALKTALPKLVLGLVLVNFTYIGGKVILDVTNVATTAAFALPEMVEDFSFAEERSDFEQKVCYKKFVAEGSSENEYWHEGNARIYVKPFCELSDEESGEKDASGKAYKIYKGGLNEFASVTYFQELNANNIGLVMAVNMGALESLELLDSEKVESFTDLAIASIFALVMYLVFALSYLVLGVLLLTRVIVLWIALALSPIAVLFYVVPQLKEWMGSGGDLSSKVVKHLLSPIIVGLTMTLGYLMISAWDGVARGSGSEASLKFNELMAEEFLMSGIDDLPKFMIAIASVVIVWVGVFAAAEGTIADSITGQIKEFGGKIGGALAKAPLTIPSIPVFTKGDDGKEKRTPMSLLGVSKLMDQGLYHMSEGRVQNELTTLAENSNSDLLKTIIGRGGDASNMTPRQNAARLNKTVTDARDKNDKYLTKSDMTDMAGDLMNMVKHADLKDDRINELIKTVEGGGKEGIDALKSLGDDSRIQRILEQNQIDADTLSTESLDGFTHIKPPEAKTPAAPAEPPAATNTLRTVMTSNKTALQASIDKVPDTYADKSKLGDVQTQMLTASTAFDTATTEEAKTAAKDQIKAADTALEAISPTDADKEATAAKKELERVLNELKTQAGVTS